MSKYLGKQFLLLCSNDKLLSNESMYFSVNNFHGFLLVSTICMILKDL